MEMGRYILAAISFSVAGAGAFGETLFVRPGPCAAQETFLLAVNSAAIIRRDPSQQDVIVFRQQEKRGWASRRLLRRFDLSVAESGPVIVNSGDFCRSSQ